MFAVGTEVQADYLGKGIFYPGTIVSASIDTSKGSPHRRLYSIQYADGDFEHSVPAPLVRRLPAKLQRQLRQLKGQSNKREAAAAAVRGAPGAGAKATEVAVGEEHYEVERILGKRRSKQHKSMEYLVR